MKLAAFYHLCVRENWQESAYSYFQALEQSGFDGRLAVGLVGPEVETIAAEATIPFPHNPIYAAGGWEEITLDAVRTYALKNSGAVMYATTDALSHSVPVRRVIEGWRTNLRRLRNHEVLGCLAPSRDNDEPSINVNFWMAKCSYVRKLAPYLHLDHSEAETWIESGSPEMVKLETFDPGIRNRQSLVLR